MNNRKIQYSSQGVWGWVATFDDYDGPGSPLGHGDTQEQAKEALLEDAQMKQELYEERVFNTEQLKARQIGFRLIPFTGWPKLRVRVDLACSRCNETREESGHRALYYGVAEDIRARAEFGYWTFQDGEAFCRNCSLEHAAEVLQEAVEELRRDNDKAEKQL